MADWKIEVDPPSQQRVQNGWTDLHQAALANDIDRAAMLLAEGIDPNVADVAGVTPLMMSVEDCLGTYPPIFGPGVELQKRPRSAPSVRRLLLEAGADPNARDAAGRSALHYAASRIDIKSVEDLLAHGADPHGLDYRGRSSHSLARAYIQPWEDDFTIPDEAKRILDLIERHSTGEARPETAALP